MGRVPAERGMSTADGWEWASRYATSGLPVMALNWITPDGACSCRKPDCGSAGKHPLTRHGKDDATLDLGLIAEWAARWPLANIGVRPPDGVFVLDVDPRNGGATALANLTREYGALPETLTCRTGSGGLHVWLQSSDPIRRGKLAPGVDVKHSGGYLVAPPSRHVCGGTYEWVNQAAPAPAPWWVRERLNPPPAPRREFKSSDPTRRLAGLVRYVHEAPEGELNTRLYWASCRAHEDGMDTEPLVEAAIAAGHPERGARATADSAANAPSRTGVMA